MEFTSKTRKVTINVPVTIEVELDFENLWLVKDFDAISKENIRLELRKMTTKQRRELFN